MANLEIKPTGAMLRRITAVFLAAVAIVGSLVYLLTSGGGELFSPKVTIITFMPDSEGLAVKSPVRLSGLKIGVVSSVDLSGYRDVQRAIRVVMRVRASFLSSIPSDSQTALGADTLIGDKFIGITPGQSPVFIAAGGELPSEPFKQAADKADLVRAIGNDLRAVDKILADLSNPETPIGSLIMGDAEYGNAMDKVTTFNLAVHSFVGPESATGQLFFGTELYDRVHGPLVELDKQLDAIEASKLISSTQQYDDLVSQLRQLRQTLAAVKVTEDSAAYARLQQLMRQADAAISSLDLGRIHTYEALNGKLRDLEFLLRDVRIEPRKYLRLKVF